MRPRGSLDRVRSIVELVLGAESLTCMVLAGCVSVFVLRRLSENALYTQHAPSRAFWKASLESSCPFCMLTSAAQAWSRPSILSQP